MPLNLILKRMGRNARDMILLCAAISLVAGFFAFAPLYLRSVGESGLRYALDTAQPGATDLIVRNRVRTDLADRAILTESLGDLIASFETTTRSGQVICAPYNQLGECFGDEDNRAYISVSFENLEQRFTVVEGRYPDAPGEAAVTAEVATFGDLHLGDSFDLDMESATPQQIEIVGLLEPVDPADPFWILQVATTRGILLDVNENFQRFDFGLIFPDEFYDQQILPVVSSGVEYDWYIQTNTDTMQATSLSDLAARLDSVRNAFRLKYTEAEVRGGLPILINAVQSGITAAEGTVILFASGVLFLMLYQLTAISALVLETQTAEWASITSRGGSIAQLVRAQLVTMIILGAAAAVFGLIVAYALLAFIGQTGPLASVVGAGLVELPLISIVLSAGAALLAILALTLPAIPAARRGILALKQAMSRPASKPIWAKYYLDIGLLLLGIALILRLYFLTGGDDPAAILSDPSLLIRLITAAGAQDAGLLRDPFNLIAAALVVTGLGMLWLRLFPLILRVVSTVGERLNGLLVSLAFWNVARDPNHYAQLVLVLIVTLGIGTASLALSATHDAGAWAVARDQTGADVRMTFPTDNQPPADLSLPDVTSIEPVARYTTTERAGERTTTVFGIDPATFPQTVPGAASVAALLIDHEMPPLPGLTLPEGTTALTMQVYASPHEAGETIRTRLGLEVENSLGVRYTVPFTTADDTVTGAFVPFRADLPADPYQPLRLVGFRFLSRINLSTPFRHQLFLDDLAVIDTSGNVTELDSFERLTMPEWTAANRGSSGQNLGLLVTPTQAQALTGNYSLRVDYTIAMRGATLIEPVLTAYPVSEQFRLPIVLSTAAAETLGRRTSAVRRVYRVGDTGVLTLQLREGVLDVPMEIVGIVPTFATMNAGDFFAVARTEHLTRALNVIAEPDAPYIANERWLTLPDREPSAALRDAITALTTSLSVGEGAREPMSPEAVSSSNSSAPSTPLFYGEGSGVRSDTTALIAWDRYNALLRVPLPNAVAGVLFGGFWVALALGLLDFAFYLAMTARRRANAFAVLRALGWKAERLWGMLTVEQAALVAPALIIGVGLGGLLAYLLLPFLALIGDETLRFPMAQIGMLLAALIVGFAALLSWAALTLRRMSVNQMLRAGDE